jgi:hypothetical protein
MQSAAERLLHREVATLRARRTVLLRSPLQGPRPEHVRSRAQCLCAAGIVTLSTSFTPRSAGRIKACHGATLVAGDNELRARDSARPLVVDERWGHAGIVAI